MPNNYDILEILQEYGLKNLHYGEVNFKHFAVIYEEKKKTQNIISFGMNHMRDGKPIHAEMDAINNLPPAKKKNRLTHINLMVIRISKSLGIMANSKCCIKCCETIYRIPPLRGYTIDQVYYSNTEFEIESSHPIELLLEDTVHTSLYFERKGYKPRIPSRIKKTPNSKEKLFLRKKAIEDESFSTSSWSDID
jgi:hypothetical protein